MPIIDYDTFVEGITEQQCQSAVPLAEEEVSVSEVSQFISDVSGGLFRAIRKSKKVASRRIHDFPVMYGQRLISNTLYLSGPV